MAALSAFFVDLTTRRFQSGNLVFLRPRVGQSAVGTIRLISHGNGRRPRLFLIQGGKKEQGSLCCPRQWKTWRKVLEKPRNAKNPKKID